MWALFLLEKIVHLCLKNEQDFTVVERDCKLRRANCYLRNTMRLLLPRDPSSSQGLIYLLLLSIRRRARAASISFPLRIAIQRLVIMQISFKLITNRRT